jgi:hypothetical protein
MTTSTEPTEYEGIAWRAGDDIDKPSVELSSGNAMLIIGACAKAARRDGWTDREIADLAAEMMSGDYDQLLQTAMRYFVVELR